MSYPTCSSELSHEVLKEMDSIKLDEGFAQQAAKLFSELTSMLDEPYFDSPFLFEEGVKFGDNQENQVETNLGSHSFSSPTSEEISLGKPDEFDLAKDLTEDSGLCQEKTLTGRTSDSSLEYQVQVPDELATTPPIEEWLVGVKNEEQLTPKPVVAKKKRRKDVIFKSILRLMKRFFQNKFEKDGKYNRGLKNKKEKNQRLIQTAVEICEECGLTNSAPGMAFYIASASYSCEMRKFLYLSKSQNSTKISEINQCINIINLIDNAMNKFSMKVFSNFMDIPQIAILINYFLSIPHEEFEQTDEFDEYIETLNSKSQKMIRSYNRTNYTRKYSSYTLKKDPSFLYPKTESTPVHQVPE